MIGLMKKTLELSILCGVDVGLVVFKRSDITQKEDMSVCSNIRMEDLIARYNRFDGEHQVVNLDQLSILNPNKLKVTFPRAQKRNTSNETIQRKTNKSYRPASGSKVEMKKTVPTEVKQHLPVAASSVQYAEPETFGCTLRPSDTMTPKDYSMVNPPQVELTHKPKVVSRATWTVSMAKGRKRSFQSVESSRPQVRQQVRPLQHQVYAPFPQKFTSARPQSSIDTYDTMHQRYKRARPMPYREVSTTRFDLGVIPRPVPNDQSPTRTPPQSAMSPSRRNLNDLLHVSEQLRQKEMKLMKFFQHAAFKRDRSIESRLALPQMLLPTTRS